MMRARSGQVDRSGSMLHDIGSHPREEGMAEGTPGFEDDIKPLFRESDRKRMEFAFDLWSHEDVKQNAEAILERLEEGDMPCDGAWPDEQVDAFKSWLQSGMNP